MTILSKKEMSEEDIKLQYITPAILAKWDKSRITMETRITDGKICLNGNFVHRDKKSAKFADYVLYWSSSFPIAIVEAKDNNHSVSFGLQQAIAYAQMKLNPATTYRFRIRAYKQILGKTIYGAYTTISATTAS